MHVVDEKNSTKNTSALDVPSGRMVSPKDIMMNFSTSEETTHNNLSNMNVTDILVDIKNTTTHGRPMFIIIQCNLKII